MGYNPRYRGKRSYDPLLCLEDNSAFLWDAELRPGNAGTWDGSVELLASVFMNIPTEVREVRVRADAGFGFHPVLEMLEHYPAPYAVVARMTPGLKRRLGGLRYHLTSPPTQRAVVGLAVHWIRRCQNKRQATMSGFYDAMAAQPSEKTFSFVTVSKSSWLPTRKIRQVASFSDC